VSGCYLVTATVHSIGKLTRARADVSKLRAQNNEGFPFFNAVTADLTPVSKSKVNVQFDTFKIGNIVPNARWTSYPATSQHTESVTPKA